MTAHHSRGQLLLAVQSLALASAPDLSVATVVALERLFISSDPTRFARDAAAPARSNTHHTSYFHKRLCLAESFFLSKKITTFLSGSYFEIVLATIFVASVFALFAMLVIIVAI
jgi:hypothetical protein